MRRNAPSRTFYRMWELGIFSVGVILRGVREMLRGINDLEFLILIPDDATVNKKSTGSWRLSSPIYPTF